MIRRITPADNEAIASVIQTTMTELCIVGPGASQNDPSMSALSEAYSEGRSAYFVVVDENGTVIGGAGIAAMPSADQTDRRFCRLVCSKPESYDVQIHFL